MVRHTAPHVARAPGQVEQAGVLTDLRRKGRGGAHLTAQHAHEHVHRRCGVKLRSHGRRRHRRGLAPGQLLPRWQPSAPVAKRVRLWPRKVPTLRACYPASLAQLTGRREPWGKGDRAQCRSLRTTSTSSSTGTCRSRVRGPPRRAGLLAPGSLAVEQDTPCPARPPRVACPVRAAASRPGTHACTPGNALAQASSTAPSALATRARCIGRAAALTVQRCPPARSSPSSRRASNTWSWRPT